MDEVRLRILLGIVSALITSVGTYYGTSHHYLEKVDSGAREIGSLRIRQQNANERIVDLERKKETLSTQLNVLQREYGILEEKYRKCTTADGITHFQSSFESNWSQHSLSTGQQIRFKLSSSSLYFKLVHVTKSGPIGRIEGCDYPFVMQGAKSPTDGSHAYLLQKGNTLHIQASSRACAEGWTIEYLKDVEDIMIECIEFDVEAQTAILRHRKSFSKEP